MGFSNPIIGGGGALVYPSIHSPDYVTGVSGWSLKKNGNFEAANALIRGEFSGTDHIVNATGDFYYDGTPGVGNLSVSHVPGTVNVNDDFNNIALPGDTIYKTPLALNSIAFSIQQGIMIWYTWNGANWGIGPSIDWTPASNFIEFLQAPLRSLDGTRSNPTIISTDSWTNFSAFGANFGAGGPLPQQCLMPAGPNNAGCIKLRGQVLATAATAANSTMCVAFAGPTQNMSWIVPTNAAGYTPPARVVTIDTSGNIRMQPTMANNNFVLLDGIEIPLG